MYDLIGDIHGHCTELKTLLNKLGYKENEKGFYHPNGRKAFFVGDYIDRGNEIRETLSLVKNMADNNQAIALMGNHEFNALAYHTLDTNGEPCRPHLEKNNVQHQETLNQFKDYQEEWKMYMKWMMALPLFYEGENFRAVHATWDNQTIKFLKEKLGGNKFTSKSQIIEATKQDTQLFEAIEIALKGKELSLPNDLSYHDKDGHNRSSTRVKWWMDTSNLTWREYSIIDLEELPDEKIETKSDSHYQDNELPVFFGHYWMSGKAVLQKYNVCCLDYSVAKHGGLVAYRFNNEATLEESNFVRVESIN